MHVILNTPLQMRLSHLKCVRHPHTSETRANAYFDLITIINFAINILSKRSPLCCVFWSAQQAVNGNIIQENLIDSSYCSSATQPFCQSGESNIPLLHASPSFNGHFIHFLRDTPSSFVVFVILRLFIYSATLRTTVMTTTTPALCLAFHSTYQPPTISGVLLVISFTTASVANELGREPACTAVPSRRRSPQTHTKNAEKSAP